MAAVSYPFQADAMSECLFAHTDILPVLFGRYAGHVPVKSQLILHMLKPFYL